MTSDATQALGAIVILSNETWLLMVKSDGIGSEAPQMRRCFKGWVWHLCR